MDTYHATTAEDLTLYEWWVTPHRLDGLPFHDFMMTANARQGTVCGQEAGAPEAGQTRLDLSNLHIQRYELYLVDQQRRRSRSAGGGA